MLTPLRNQRGSALMVAVIAMLIMGVLSLSFSILANIESRIGISYKQQAQAEALAEAGLEAARDVVRNGGASSTGFTPWFGGTYNHTLVTNAPLNGGTYSARIDNDCFDATVFPPPQETVGSKVGMESDLTGGCDNANDKNKRAVITAWASVGAGKARVRAILGEDDPWKHVCSNSSADPGGPLCNAPGNQNGNPAVNPADPAHENGPKGWDDLPRPIIGCSRIDPTLHGMNFGTCAGLSGTTKALFAQPAVAAGSHGAIAPGYPAYPSATGSNLVIMGEDPTITTGVPVKTCSGGGVTYFGYFDCALTTYCHPSDHGACPGGTAVPGDVRKACVHPSDTRLSDTARYVAPTLSGGTTGDVTSGCVAAGGTGMVFLGDTNFKNNYGSATNAFLTYVATTGGVGTKVEVRTQDVEIFGTMVVEGDWETVNKTFVCAGWPLGSPVPANGCPGSTAGSTTYQADSSKYGYPLAGLVYDPKLPYPTVSPNAPQDIFVDFGSNNVNINGSVYTGGHLSFNPINVNGSSVGFEIQLQSTTSSYVYQSTYGGASPPPGFMSSSGPVAIVRKSFIVCSTYSESTTSEAAGPTQCK